MFIDAGELNRRIRIILPDATRDANGYQVKKADAAANGKVIHSCKARFTRTSGTEKAKADGDFSEERVRFVIRWTPKAIDRKMVVLYRNKPYQIEYINDYGGKQYMEIWGVWTDNDGGGASDDQ